MVSPDEFTGLLEIYNRYPLKELILHPRVRTDYYKNTPNMPAFGSGFDGSRAPVCYNGDIFTVSGYETLCGDYPELDRVMLGRGIISNPGRNLKAIPPDDIRRLPDNHVRGQKCPV